MLSFFDPLLILGAFCICGYGFYRRAALWRIGTAEHRTDNLGARSRTTLSQIFGHGRILRERVPGLMHLFLFYGFVIPFLVVILFQLFFSLPPPFGNIFSLILDCVGFLGLVGIIIAFIRRYIQKPTRLESTPQDAIGLALISCILLFGFLVEGFRMGSLVTPASVWSPVGSVVAGVFHGLGLSRLLHATLHGVVWRIHFLLILGFIAYIPYSKLFHILVSPLNILLRSHGPKGALQSIDIETAETFGVSTIKEFTWKQLLDLDACMQCGRCQDRCPAHLSEKPLTPRKVISDLKNHLHSEGPKVLKMKAESGSDAGADQTLVGETIAEDELWACTTCRACMEICPVYVEHVDKIVDMRRYQVLMESRFPQEVVATFKNMETNSNPWGIGWAARADWSEDLEVKTLSESSDADILFYVGCAGSFDERYKQVAVAFVKILRAAGINFAILGTEEKCCGDSARRIGNEYLFQMMAMENIENMKNYGVERVVTLCPHCFNTLKNEYPQCDGLFHVVHYTEFLSDLLSNGQLRLVKECDRTIAYHDSCYLGRYNDIYDAPRKILSMIPGITRVELERWGANSFCCGAGGGRMWMEELIGQRINEVRIEEILKKKPNIIGTACPYCLTMFEDGIKAKDAEEQLVAQDLIELIARSME
ncbi:MAG: 4Fe-4S dicluster domain-containing protein [Gemmatimonadota bacterium]|nr:MAG: 4Fe-4S dicluster domain-containing protein [Gemmatimonadota bacterium]